MSLENEIGDKPLTFILILKKLWGRWVEPWDLLLPSTFSSSNLLLIPPSYSTLLPIILLFPLTSSLTVSDD